VKSRHSHSIGPIANRAIRQQLSAGCTNMLDVDGDAIQHGLYVSDFGLKSKQIGNGHNERRSLRLMRAVITA
jgi:hypothetical protein